MKKNIFILLLFLLFFAIVNIVSAENNCIKEGQIFDSSEDPNKKCCEGLQEKSQYDLRNCIILPSLKYTCVICGNGECGLGENKCNCPQDCSSQESAITSNSVCARAGEEVDVHGANWGGKTKCCEGLTAVAVNVEPHNGECSSNYPPYGTQFLCINCGDGICGVKENKCNCPQDCNTTVVGTEKVKIMPEVASQKAIEKLENLGFNVQLKEVGKDESAKYIYAVNGLKDVKFLGIFSVKMKMTAEVDTESGEVKNIKKPWWSFLAW